MIEALSSAQSGIRAATDLMSSAAANVAKINVPEPQAVPQAESAAAATSTVPGAGNNVDIAGQMMAMMMASTMAKANVTTARSAIHVYDEVLKLRVAATAKQTT